MKMVAGPGLAGPPVDFSWISCMDPGYPCRSLCAVCRQSQAAFDAVAENFRQTRNKEKTKQKKIKIKKIKTNKKKKKKEIMN